MPPHCCLFFSRTLSCFILHFQFSSTSFQFLLHIIFIKIVVPIFLILFGSISFVFLLLVLFYSFFGFIPDPTLAMGRVGLILNICCALNRGSTDNPIMRTAIAVINK